MTDHSVTSPLILVESRIVAGVWEGMLEHSGKGAPSMPQVNVTHLGIALDGVEIAPVPGAAGIWTLRVPVPPRLLSDGVQSFVIADSQSGATLGAFAIAMGDALEGDLRAELQLLRAELDLLKAAFRRHCVETS